MQVDFTAARGLRVLHSFLEERFSFASTITQMGVRRLRRTDEAGSR